MVLAYLWTKRQRKTSGDTFFHNHNYKEIRKKGARERVGWKGKTGKGMLRNGRWKREVYILYECIRCCSEYFRLVETPKTGRFHIESKQTTMSSLFRIVAYLVSLAVPVAFGQDTRGLQRRTDVNKRRLSCLVFGID